MLIQIINKNNHSDQVYSIDLQNYQDIILYNNLNHVIEMNQFDLVHFHFINTILNYITLNESNKQEYLSIHIRRPLDMHNITNNNIPQWYWDNMLEIHHTNCNDLKKLVPIYELIHTLNMPVLFELLTAFFAYQLYWNQIENSTSL
jgi:hypothetical protein